MLKFSTVALAALAFIGCVDDEAELDSAGSALTGAPLICPAPKVLVCHLPPGRPTNAHEICIGASAVKAHLVNHADRLGACLPACSREGQECTTDGNCCDGAICGYEGVCTTFTPT